MGACKDTCLRGWLNRPDHWSCRAFISSTSAENYTLVEFGWAVQGLFEVTPTRFRDVWVLGLALVVAHVRCESDQVLSASAVERSLNRNGACMTRRNLEIAGHCGCATYANSAFDVRTVVTMMVGISF